MKGCAGMNSLNELSGGHAILDIVSYLVANARQFQQFLLDQRVVSFLGQFSVLSGFVPKIVVPVHATPPSSNAQIGFPHSLIGLDLGRGPAEGYPSRLKNVAAVSDSESGARILLDQQDR